MDFRNPATRVVFYLRRQERRREEIVSLLRDIERHLSIQAANSIDLEALRRRVADLEDELRRRG